MVVRLGGAICVAAVTLACSSYSVSSNGIEKEITSRPVASGPGIVGVASSYNPYRKDYRSGDIKTASVSGILPRSIFYISPITSIPKIRPMGSQRILFAIR